MVLMVQAAHSRIQIQLHGAPAPGALVAVGAEHAFAYGLGLRAHAFLADEAMGDQLTASFAMRALRQIELAGLLTDSLKAGVVDLHDRTDMGGDAHLAGLNLWRGNSLGRIGVIKPSCCFDGKLARNSRFVRWERGKSHRS